MVSRGSFASGYRSAVAVLGMVACVLAATGCQGGSGTTEAGKTSEEGTTTEQVVDNTPDVKLSYDMARRGVPVDTKVSLSAEQGTLERVKVRGPKQVQKRVAGEISDDGTTWTATEPLEPSATYRIKTVAVDAEGRTLREKHRFRSENLSLDEQTYPNMIPLEGETVGVGMPVIIQFDVPVSDKASIERHLSIESEPKVHGTWHWYSDTEVHFRPRNFWKPGSEVTVHADVNSVDAGNGIYGQLDRTMSFEVGSRVVSKIFVNQHKMKTFINGSLARVIPVSAGMEGYETRRGTKIIMEKFESKRMDAATTGVSRNDPEYYNIANVKWAMRVTYSGEFVHGAPWSVGSQGDANVSHGCVGMSLTDAKWLYDRSTRGDVVKVYGTDREIEPGNGWTDWDISYAEYKEGSALN